MDFDDFLAEKSDAINARIKELKDRNIQNTSAADNFDFKSFKLQAGLLSLMS